MREAPDKESYQRRLAVWLTRIGPFPAHQIAEWLCVSKQAIWLWIGQYNHQGPEALGRVGRGGRRWAYLTLEEEETLLRRFQRQAAEGKLLTAQQLHAQLVERTGRKLTLGYVYGLLHRQEWRKLGPRPRHPRAGPTERPKTGSKKTPPTPGNRAEAGSSRDARVPVVPGRGSLWPHQRPALLLGPLPLRPVVGHQIVRQFVYGLAAVSPLDGELCSLVLPWVDTEAMSLFLAHTAARFPHQYCLRLLDGAGWYRALALPVPPHMQLLPLPPYSPGLNPVEHPWDHLRENGLGNRVFHSLEQVVQQVCRGLKTLHQQPKLVQSMTCFDWFDTLHLTLNWFSRECSSASKIRGLYF